jgi:lysophospholipase L1-like esterase
VWNAAVPGYNTVQQAAMLETLAPRVKPDLVLVAFCMNDYLDPPRLTENGRLDATAPTSAGPVPLTSYLWYSRTLVFTKEKIKDLQKAYPEWFPVWTHDIHYLTQRPGWTRAQQALLRMQQTAERNGAKMLLVIFPVEQQLRLDERSAQDDLSRFAQEHRIDVLDLFPTFRAHWQDDLYVGWWSEVGSVDKLHLNARGHRLAADEIAAQILARFAQPPGRSAASH